MLPHIFAPKEIANSCAKLSRIDTKLLEIWPNLPFSFNGARLVNQENPSMS